MYNFSIITDSSNDLTRDTLDSLDVRSTDLTFLYDGEETVYKNGDVTPHDFYGRMRKGSTVKTSAVNSATIKEVIEEELKAGKDVLYIGFSSGLSTTYNCACTAAEELKTEYPERKLIVIDSLSASAGMGMIVMLASQKRAAGMTIEETAEYLNLVKLKICHWFTVDDLQYLRKGGRISKAVAVVGDILNIKPLLNMSNDGKLVSISKCRGRRNALKALCERIETSHIQENSPIFISHGDCPEDAKILTEMIKERYGKAVDMTVCVGPVIGGHSGPGTMALFFIGEER